MSRRKTLSSVTLVVALAVAVGLPVLSCSAPELGLVNGQLKACPNSPNCVNSQDPDPDRRVDPLPLPAGEADPMKRLAEILAEQPRVEILEARDDYLHAIFISRFMRFPDDVEFLLDRDARVFHVRSASRVGYSDMGANATRVERLRALLSP
jgi:uncharacterized protein (DUF1499 family)